MLKHLMYSFIDRFGENLIPYVRNPLHKLTINTVKLNCLKEHHDTPLKIVHISDLHIGFQFSYDDLIQVIQEVNNLKPHIVCITGDMFDNLDRFKENSARYIPLLKTIRAKHKFFVYGNHDQRAHRTHDLERIMHHAEIEVLNNYGKYIHFDDEAIYICGTDDIINSGGNIQQMLSNKDNSAYTIALIHEPDFARFTKRFDVDLQLSGHSHGGQIRLPIIGAPIRPMLGRKYYSGLYTLKYKRRKMKLYTSNGLGTTHFPFRIGARPEITLFEIT
ncbi:metallophosphoesterase [Macrococcus armenti]|uniref:Metallophosphoesterase n=1 Tax=Macrococcus armenti TaxID=2875764 RepID=A0ABY3ZWG4_9STAP|nr:metallophosphoesterase [Macrococcus armenti]UOB21257.1 metallophosphoesterase [Macrococcus armenti]